MTGFILKPSKNNKKMGLLDTISDIVSLPVSIWQTKYNANVQKRNVDMTNQSNMNLAQFQYNKDVEMWNRANAYNTPASQMERFKQAGLNPNLIYGQGSSGNSPNTLPRYQAPTARFDYQPAVDLPAMLSLFQDFRIKSAQVDNLREMNQTKKLENIKRENALLWEYGVGKAGEDLRLGVPNAGYRQKMLEDRSELYKYQSIVASRTLNDQINKIRLNNAKAIASTRLTNNLADYKAKDVDFYTGQAIAGIISRLASSFGVGNMLGNLAKKQPVIIKR